MTTTNDRIIKEVLGRMAEDAPAALQFKELGFPVVRGAGVRDRRPSWVFVASGVAAFVGVLVIGALVFSTVSRSPTGPDELPSAVGSPSPATLDEFDAAVRPAVDALLEAPGFEAVQMSYLQEYLATSVRLESLRNGDFVAVQLTDINVTETAWWLLGEGPPAGGRQVSPFVTIRVGDTVYTAPDAGNSGWRMDVRPDYPRGTTEFERALLSDTFEALLLPESSDVTRQDLVGGGVVWTVTAPGDEATSILSWFIDADGKLAVYTGELVNLSGSMAPENRVPIDSWNIRFTPVVDPTRITAPDLEAAFDLSQFELPEGLPLGN